MPDYETMYFRLFNRMTDVIQMLQQAQQEGEKIFIESGDTHPDQIESGIFGEHDRT